MRRSFAALLALCVLMLAGCAKKTEPESEAAVSDPPPAVVEPVPAPEREPDPEPPEDSGDAVYAFHDLKVPVPAEYVELLVIDSELEVWNEHRTPLVSFSEKASVDAGRQEQHDEDWGDGFLCTLSVLDRVGFEDWLSGSGSDTGERVFARDGSDRYYLISYPTDVRLYRSGLDLGGDASLSEIEGLEMWTALNEWAARLPEAIIEENALEAYDAGELYAADYTYPGEHVELGYRIPGDAMDLVLLELSQPAAQGDGGVWCVERVRYVYSDYGYTDTRLVFPAALGVDETAADYYARIQDECDRGEHPALLTPRGAALDYARQAVWLFGEDVSETDFEVIDSLG